MPDASWPDFCAATIAELQAELPIASPAQQVRLRRQIREWRAKAKQKPARVVDKPKPRRVAHPGQWRVGCV